MPDTPSTALGILERVSVLLGGRVDALETEYARLDERVTALREGLEAQKERCEKTQDAKAVQRPWFRRTILDPAVKQPHLIALYALVLLLGAKSCGIDTSDLTALWGAAPTPIEATP